MPTSSTTVPSEAEVAAWLATALKDKVVIRNKFYSLRVGVPEVLPATSYFIEDMAVMPQRDLPAYIHQLREHGEGKGFIPATKGLYDFLTEAGIAAQKLEEHEDRLAIVPADFICKMVIERLPKQQQKAAKKRFADVTAADATQAESEAAAAPPSKAGAEAPAADGASASSDSLAAWIDHPCFAAIAAHNLVIAGPARHSLRCAPAYILTLGEAVLKSKMHLTAMANALMRRLREIVPDSYHVTRFGDNVIHLNPAKLLSDAQKSGQTNTTQREAFAYSEEALVQYMAEYPIDIETLKLIPGIAKIYSAPTVPVAMIAAEATMARIDAGRAERLAQGLPADAEYVEGGDAPLLLDAQGRPVRFPAQYVYNEARLTVECEKRRKLRRAVYGEVIADGAGGLPVQQTMRALCLMSGGIDSPVAAYHMMKRGCRVDFVHFLNSTSDTGSILAKLTLIAKRLSRVQGRIDMRLVDIAELQNAIIGAVARVDRTVVYKQFMLLIAAAIANYDILVTGDSVAQVASQTVANVSTLYPLTPRAIISPLSGTNKTDVIDVSRRVGLLDFSQMEGADCCQYLMCKTGANLCIGSGKMLNYLGRIPGSITSLPVKVVVFDNGEEVPSAGYTESLPFAAVRANVPCQLGDELADTMAAAHPRAQRREEAMRVAAANGGVLVSKTGRVSTVAPHKYAKAAASMAASESDPAKQMETDSTAAPAAAASEAAVARPPQQAPARRPREVYLDSAAATIVDPAVVEAMARAPVGNPNSLHTLGRVCRAAVEGVRHQLLSFLCPSLAVPFKLAFTSGGTEANNLGLAALASLLREGLDDATADDRRPTAVLYSSIAHPSVTKVCERLAAKGVVSVAEAIPVSRDGQLDMAWLEKRLQQASAFGANGLYTRSGRATPTDEARPWSNVLVAVDIVNHELGCLRDVDAIVAVARRYGALLHGDACQALCKVDVDATVFDAVSVTAHKINGPVGIGALAMRAKYVPSVDTTMTGGSFDSDLRPGTLNAPAIVGFGAALSLPRDEELPKAAFDLLVSSLRKMPSLVRINGTPERSSGRIVHLTLSGASPALRRLDDAELVSLFASKYNIMLSTGAACSQHKKGTETAANTLYSALGVEPGPTLRVSIDHTITASHIRTFIDALREVLNA